MAPYSLTWLHPDGRVGGRGPDGKPVWTRSGVLGDAIVPGAEGPRFDPSSPFRRPATCPVSDRCGGCDQDRVVPTRRHEALAAMVGRAYRLDAPPPLITHSATTGTRARVKLSIQDGRVGMRPRRSHDLVAIQACDTARPELQPVLARLASTPLPEGLDHVELRSDGERVMASFHRPRRARRAVTLPELGVPTALDGRPVHGDPCLWLTVMERALRVSPLAFYQVHLELNEQLVAYVRDQIRAFAPERVLDLYAGVGNLGLPVADLGVPVAAVELEGQATADLRHNAGGANVEILTGKVERFDPSTTPYDAVIMDPPRAGAGPVVDRVLRNRPKGVVHVACDPVAGARDAARARKAGYRVVDVRCFDLFPQTHHVETVSVWAR